MPEYDIDVRKGNVKMAVSVFLRTVLAAVLCLFVYLSISMVASGMTQKEKGYQIWETDSNGSKVLIEEYVNPTGAEAVTTTNTVAGPATAPTVDKPAQTTTTAATASTVSAGTGSTAAGAAAGTAAASGATTTVGAASSTLPTNQQKVKTYYPMSKGASLLADIIAEIFMILLLISFPYSILWAQGDRDKNNVQFGHMAEDKLRGLKVGLMAAVPSGVSYLLLLLSKLGVMPAWYLVAYRFLNIPFLPILSRMAGGVTVANTPDVSWLGIAGMFLPLLLLPLVCYVAYMLGYKQISLSEKFVYVNPNKKKKRRR